MAVAFVNKATVSAQGGATTSNSLAFTPTAGSTLLIGVAAYGAATTLPSSPTMTYNAVSMTLIGSKVNSTNQSVYVFGLINPPTGASHTLLNSYTAGDSGSGQYLDCFTFSGTDTSSLANAVPSVNVLTDASTGTAGGIYPSSAFSVTTANGDAACSACSCDQTQYSSMATGTLINTNGAVNGNYTSGYKLATTTATTLQFSGGAPSEPTCGVAFRIQQPQSAVTPESNFHFSGKLTPAKLNTFDALWQNQADDTQEPTNVHIVGRAQPVKLMMNLGLLTQPPQDFNDPTIVYPETNPHFVGRFTPVKLMTLSLLIQNTANDISLEQNPHFAGRFTPAKVATLPLLSQQTANDLNQPGIVYPETNTHFQGRFVPVRPVPLPLVWQNAISDAPATFIAETNTHFIGKYAPVAPKLLPLLYQNQDIQTSQVVGPETNPHFQGRFAPAIIKTLALTRQQTANDTSSPTVQPETNVHFIGRLQPTVVRLNTKLIFQDAKDFSSVPETNPHFLGRFTPAVLKMNTWLRYQPDTTGISALPVITFHKFNAFTDALLKGIHHLSTDTIKIMLSDSAPNAGNAIKSDITEIAAGNGYPAGGPALTGVLLTNLAGLETMFANPWIITAAGGNIAQFRYAILYNATAAAGNLIGWYDNQNEVNISSGNAYELLFDVVNGVLNLQ